MVRGRFFFPLLFALVALAAACGGGGGGSNPVPSAPTPTPHSGPTSVPVGPTPQAVVLTGGGYTLSFFVPPIVTGSTSTMNAVLQTTLPSGTTAPQGAKRGYNSPRPLAMTFSGLVYLVISTTDTVGFSSSPAFQYTLPTGTTIPSGSNTYLLYWDPYQSGSTGWIPLLGPGRVNGQSISFTSAQTGVQFVANQQYVFALAETTQAIPTATPAPTPTPTVNPSASPAQLPAYCANYKPATANAISVPEKVVISNQSATGAQVYLYVVEGADSGGQTRYLGIDGALHDFSGTATAPPIPLECFPGSAGGNGQFFYLPPPSSTGYGANLYLALATPSPGDSAPPNPLRFSATGTGYNGPSIDPSSANFAGAPFEFIEYQLPSATLDITQVDKVGLPILMEQNSATYGDVQIGFPSVTPYQSLLYSISQVPYYKNLLVSTQLNGKNVISRILSPQDGAPYGFPQDWWYNSNYNTSQSAGGLGYLGYVMRQYQTSPSLYTLSGSPGSGDNYCVSSDGSANFLFYDVKTTTSCSSLPGTPITMKIASTFEGTTLVDGVCQAIIPATPYGPGNFPYGGGDAFYLWKAMVLELNRGVALENTTHPVNGWSTAPSPLPPFSAWYPAGQVFNVYGQLVHDEMAGNKAYTVPYDEPGGYAPTTTNDPTATLKITIYPLSPGITSSATPDPSMTCPP